MSSDKYGFGYGEQISGNVNYGAQEPRQPTAETPVAPQSSASPKPDAQATGLLNLGQDQVEPIKDISTAEFVAEVIEASKQKPVLVDFWAPWCGPCKQLGPAIEAAVAKAGGKVKLVKMNIDDHPEVAGQMGIQSIPAVVAFVDGQPRDAFMGAKPEGEITRFIDRIAGASGPSPLDAALEEALTLAGEGKHEEAAGIYGAILQQMPDNLDAIAGYGMQMVKLERMEEAGQLLEMARQHVQPNASHSGVDALSAAIELAKAAEDVGDFAELEEKVAANPADHQARFDLAIALNGAGRREEAADHLLEIIARDRNWKEDGARQELLKFFDAWGPKEPATASARRRLSSLLFA